MPPHRIIVIGAGWYGCHIALSLSKAGHAVLLLEKNTDIVSECSGNFGIRLHRGPHYPRSPGTRHFCHADFDEFRKTYPEIVYEHLESIYAYGRSDAERFASKVSLGEFERVVFETEGARRLEDHELGRFADVEAVYDLQDPSVAVGAELRRCIAKRLTETSTELKLGTEVLKVQPASQGVTVTYRSTPGDSVERLAEADFLVNATGCRSLFLPNEGDISLCLPDLTIVYQPCIALRYEDTRPQTRPISFIVMDGWYPCLMPIIDNDFDQTFNPVFKNYIVTHGSLTVLGTFSSQHEAATLLRGMEHSSLLPHLRHAVEREMQRFWPEFRSRFVYTGWQGSVLAKPRSRSEFRAGMVIARGRVIYVVPGKIIGVMHAYRETVELIEGKREDVVVTEDGWRFIKGGSFDVGRREMGGPDEPGLRRTDGLQTYRTFVNDGAVGTDCEGWVGEGAEC